MNRTQFPNISAAVPAGFRSLHRASLRRAITNSFFQTHPRFAWLLVLTLGSAIPLSTQAGEAQVSVRAFAQDSSINATGEQIAGTPGTGHTVASANATYAAGLSTAFVHADANAFTGALHANYQATVGADTYVVGRNAFASGSGIITGSITLSGGTTPGLATFSAILEGAYNFGNSPSRYLNSMSLSYSGLVGSGPELDGRLDFDPFTSAGLFAVPLTWTQMVHPGDRIDMFLYMSGQVSGLLDTSTLDVSNTFKLTTIDLPEGYTYTPDADGFLSQFGHPSEPPPLTPVPELGSTGLMGGGVLLVAAFKRFRRRGARASAGLSGVPV